MASSSAWGIEVGSHALKAIRLESSGDRVTVADFAIIPHKKVLSTPDVDADEMVRLSLGQFISQQPDLRSGPVLVSVPGNGAFARFAKLPPVDPKKVPDIVKFEAVQQIPFPIDEVEWDYQTFASQESPEIEVGIFAITRGAVQSKLNLYGELGILPDGISISPVAVYNAVHFDQNLHEKSPGMIILDIGTTSSDIVVVDGSRCWIRTFPIGGDNFTKALISSFKLTYSKAEKLKSEAQTSKYRRQILSAMRPVFSDLAQEVQKSIGFYQSTHREADLTKLIGVGSTFKLPGLRKFLSQQVQMEITRLDDFQRLPSADNPLIAEHVLNCATAYGLALQGLELSVIDVNLMPVSVVRDRLWGQKIKWFGAAAALLVFGSMVSFARPMMDGRFRMQAPDINREISSVISRAQDIKRKFDDTTKSTEINAEPLNIRAMLTGKNIWPQIMADVGEMLASSKPQPVLYTDDDEAIAKIPPADRQILQLRSLDSQFQFSRVTKDGKEPMPTFEMTMIVETPYKGRGLELVNRSVIDWINSHGMRKGVAYQISNPRVTKVLDLKTAPAPETQADAGNQPGNRFQPRRGGGGLSVEGGGSPEGMAPMGKGGGMIRGGENYSPQNLNALAGLPSVKPWLPPDTPYYSLEVKWTVQFIAPEGAKLAVTAESGPAQGGAFSNQGSGGSQGPAPRGGGN